MLPWFCAVATALAPISSMAGPPELPPIGIPDAPPSEEAPPEPEQPAEAEPEPLAVPDAEPAMTPVPGPPPGSGPPPPPPPPPDSTRHPANTYGDPATANRGPSDIGSDEPERRPMIVRPIPTWKTVGLATSAGVAGTSMIVAIALGIPTARAARGQGDISNEINARAEASLGTDAPIDPDQGTKQICAQALTEPDPNQPGRVYNASVGEPCRRGAKLALGSSVAWGVTGVALVSTAVFTGLLFLRPRGASARAQRQHRRVWFAAGPSPQRGWNVATRVRF